MKYDDFTDSEHPDFCSEMCEIGMGKYDERHRSSGMLANRGGPMGDKAFRASKADGYDTVPAVAIAQKLGSRPAEVSIRVDTWVTDRVDGWTLPNEIKPLGFEYSMTPERAEHLAELLVEGARLAREAPLSERGPFNDGAFDSLGGAS